MRITYDPAKREWTLRERQLDFEHASRVFAGLTIDILICDSITASRELIRSAISTDAW
jgi:hypothetical protein